MISGTEKVEEAVERWQRVREWAVIFDWLATTPVYHAFDQERLNVKFEHEGDVCFQTYTVCGLLAHEFLRGHGTTVDHNWIPLRHARKLGRRCAHCWAGGDSE